MVVGAVTPNPEPRTPNPEPRTHQMLPSDYHTKLNKTLKQRNLLPKQSRILIGLSGGQDSLCLARLCLDLQARWEWHIAIVHYDHGWELDHGLAEHITQVCQNWDVKLYLEKAESKIPETEASARKYRYQALVKVATENGFDYLLTAHTLSDRSETFLYNLMRGGGVDGLTALDWTRKLNDNLLLVRPLLNFLRQETLQCCQELQLPIWEDKYNYNKKFARNRIRLDLIPYLEEHFNPQTQKHLAQTAEILREDLTYLQGETEKLFAQVASDDQSSLDRTLLKHQPLSLQRRVIKKFLEINLDKMPNFDRIEEITKLINAPNGSCSSSLGDNKMIQIQNNLMIIKSTQAI